MDTIENRTFDEIAKGDSATLVRTLTEQDIKLFAVMSGDINPAHVDPDYDRTCAFDGRSRSATPSRSRSR
jgi:acyl dehydratase